MNFHPLLSCFVIVQDWHGNRTFFGTVIGWEQISAFWKDFQVFFSFQLNGHSWVSLKWRSQKIEGSGTENDILPFLWMGKLLSRGAVGRKTGCLGIFFSPLFFHPNLASWLLRRFRLEIVGERVLQFALEILQVCSCPNDHHLGFNVKHRIWRPEGSTQICPWSLRAPVAAVQSSSHTLGS